MTEADLGRLRWHCRRGMRELDELLTRFLDEQYASATPACQHAFRELLESQDPLLHAYFLGRQPPPSAAWGELIEQITAHRPRSANDQY